MILPRLKLSFSQADPTKMILSSLLLKQPKKQAWPNSLSLLDEWMDLEFLFFKKARSQVRGLFENQIQVKA